MKDVERREAHCGQGVMHYDHGTQRLLHRLHQVTKGIDVPSDDTGGNKGVW